VCTHDDSVLLNTVISYSEDAGIRFYATAESAYVGGEGGSKCISKFALTRFRVRPVVRSSNTSERPRAPRGHRRQKRAPYMAREYGAPCTPPGSPSKRITSGGTPFDSINRRDHNGPPDGRTNDDVVCARVHNNNIPIPFGGPRRRVVWPDN